MEKPKSDSSATMNQKLLPHISPVNCAKCLENFKFLNYTIYTAVSKQILNAPNNLYYPNILVSGTPKERLMCTNECSCAESPKQHSDVLKEKLGFNEEFTTHMATDPEDLTVKSVKTDDSVESESCTNDYNCMCEACQNKYGSLPLLLQGIEQKSLEDNAQPEPSTSASTSSKRSLVCQYCNKNFNHKGDFNKHLRKHTKEQPYSCSICDRKFAHTSNLQRHLRLHSGQKPYTCQNCLKSFSRKDKLESHKRSKLCQASASFSN